MPTVTLLGPQRFSPTLGEAVARAGIAATPAQPADFTTEFLDLIMAVRVVDSLDSAGSVAANPADNAAGRARMSAANGFSPQQIKHESCHKTDKQHFTC